MKHISVPKFLNGLPAALLLSAVLSVVPFLIRPVYYMTGDDYLLNYIANGSYGMAGSSHLVFIRVLYGVLLKVLYTLTTAVNWYLVMLILLLIISFTVIYSELLRQGRWLPLIPAVIMHALVVPFFLSFTVIAFLAGGAGAILLAASLRPGRTWRRAAAVCDGLLLCMICRCLRKDAFLPCLAVMFPLLLCAFYSAVFRAEDRTRRKKILLQTAGILLLLACGAAAEEKVELYAYSQPDWHDFRNYTFARSAVVDYPPASYEASREAFEQAGLTELDYDLLRGWKYAEKSLFSEKTLREVSRITAAALTKNARINYAKRVCPRPYLLFFALPLMMFAVMLCANRSYPVVPGILGLLIFYALNVMLLFVRLRFVMRVAGPLAMLTIICLCLLPAASGQSLPRGSKRSYAAALCFSAAFLAAGTAFMMFFTRANAVPRISPDEWPKSQITAEMEAHNDTLYILDGSILNVLYYNGTPAADVMTTGRFSNIVRAGSWDTYSPRFYAQAGMLVNDPENLLTSFARTDNTVFVGTEADLIASFLQERTGALYVAEAQSFPELQTRLFRFRPYQAP